MLEGCQPYRAALPAGAVPQPLFPISGAAVSAPSQAAPVQTSAAVPSSSLFPISLQEPAAAPVSALAVTPGQPGRSTIMSGSTHLNPSTLRG